MHYLPIQRAFESNRLLHSVTINLEFFSRSVDLTLYEVRVIQPTCRHSDVPDDRMAEADGRAYQHSIGIRVGHPTASDIIYVEYSIEQGLPDNRFHLEVVVHQIQNAQLLVRLSEFHKDSLAICPESFVHSERMVGIMPFTQLDGYAPNRLQAEPSGEVPYELCLNEIKKTEDRMPSNAW